MSSNLKNLWLFPVLKIYVYYANARQYLTPLPDQIKMWENKKKSLIHKLNIVSEMPYDFCRDLKIGTTRVFQTKYLESEVQKKTVLEFKKVYHIKKQFVCIIYYKSYKCWRWVGVPCLSFSYMKKMLLTSLKNDSLTIFSTYCLSSVYSFYFY